MITWLLIVLIAVAVILFLGSIFEWLDWLFVLLDYEFYFEPLGGYLIIQYIAVAVLKIIDAFSECSWPEQAMVTLVWSIAVTTALMLIAWRFD